MVFGHRMPGWEFGQERCAGTREQALAMHKAVVLEAKRRLYPMPWTRRRLLKHFRRQRKLRRGMVTP
jgi:hypothetical protein